MGVHEVVEYVSEFYRPCRSGIRFSEFRNHQYPATILVRDRHVMRTEAHDVDDLFRKTSIFQHFERHRAIFDDVVEQSSELRFLVEPVNLE